MLTISIVWIVHLFRFTIRFALTLYAKINLVGPISFPLQSTLNLTSTTRILRHVLFLSLTRRACGEVASLEDSRSGLAHLARGPNADMSHRLLLMVFSFLHNAPLLNLKVPAAGVHQWGVQLFIQNDWPLKPDLIDLLI